RELELARAPADREERRVGERLPARQHDREALQLAQLGEQRVVLAGGQRLPGEADVVVANVAVPAAAIGQLQQRGEELVSLPGARDDAREPAHGSFARSRTPLSTSSATNVAASRS